MFNVYSLLLGGYIAMNFEKESEAIKFIAEYHDRYEARRMRITKG